MGNINSGTKTSKISQEVLIRIYRRFKVNPKKKFISSDFLCYGTGTKSIQLYLRTLLKMGLIEKTSINKKNHHNNNAWRLKVIGVRIIPREWKERDNIYKLVDKKK